MTNPFPKINQSTIDELHELAETDAGWRRYHPPGCDICGGPPAWRHFRHGLRCEICPKAP